MWRWNCCRPRHGLPVCAGPPACDPILLVEQPVSRDNQPRPSVPVFEREVIDADAARRGGDYDKVSTTALETVEWHGITVHSRYADAGELELMLDMIEELSAPERAMVQRIFCDSKRGNDFVVELRTWNEPFAWAIAEKIGEIACRRSHGHSGVSVHEGPMFGRGRSVQIDGDIGDDEPE